MAILREIVTRFGFKVDRTQFNRTAKATRELKDELGRVGRAASSSIDGVKRLALAWVSFEAARALGASTGETIVSFDRLRARLETLTGSADAAAVEFARISDLATNTPFQIDALTDAVILLGLKGFDTTNEKMGEFGDLAAAFGKDISQTSDALQALVRGEADPIEQFGFKAKFSGDQLEIAFGDDKPKRIKRTAKAIQEFVGGVSRARFAGSMAKQMDTVGGRLSNLRDSLLRFQDRVGGDSGDPTSLRAALNGLLDELIGIGSTSGNLADRLGRTLARGVRTLTDAIRWLRENSETVRSSLRLTLALVASAKLTEGVITLGKAFLALGKMSALASIKLMLIPAAILLIALIIEDLVGFAQGKDSLIGRMLDVDSADTLRASLTTLGKALSTIGKTLLEAFAILAPVLPTLIKGIAMAIVIVVKLFELFVTGLMVIGYALGVAAAEIFLFFTETIPAAWDWLITKIGDGIGWLVDKFKAFASGVADVFVLIGEAIAHPFQVAFKWIGEKFVQFLDFMVKVGEFFGKIWDKVSDTFGAIWDGIVGIAQSALDTIKSIGSAIAEPIQDAIDSMLDLLREIIRGLPSSVAAALPNDLIAFASLTIESEDRDTQFARDRERFGGGPEIYGNALTVPVVVEPTANVTINAAPDMSAPEFQKAVEDGTNAALQRTLTETYRNQAEVGEN